MGHIKIDRDTIRGLAELLEETGLTEIEVSEGDKSMRVTRGSVAQSIVATAPQAANITAPAIVDSSNAEDLDGHIGAVKSPMVGTAYLQPEPGADSFIRVGDMINEGDVLMIIEAMKVMNPLKATKSGKITQILIENAQPIEFDEVLLIVE